MRLTVSIGISSVAVWLLGPVVKAAGFSVLMLALAAISLVTCAIVSWLPGDAAVARARDAAATATATA
jgi:hypothetical protein